MRMVTGLDSMICAETYLETFLRQQDACGWAFWTNGIVAENQGIEGSSLDAAIRGKGSSFTVPFWNPLENNESAVAKKNSAAAAAHPCSLDGFSQDYMTGIIHQRQHGWEWEDLLAQCLSANEMDPADVLARQTSDYWRTQYSDMTLASLRGLYADNVANDGGDMVVAIDGTADPYMSHGAMLKVQKAMGCKGQYDGMIVHSDIFNDLQGDHQINPMTIQSENTETGEQVGNYYGRNVICACESWLNPSTDVYRTIMYKRGLFSYKEGNIKNPIASNRDECYNGGAGMEQLFQRHSLILHPNGFSFDYQNFDANSDNFSPTNTELAMANYWDRVLDRSDINLAFVEHESAI